MQSSTNQDCLAATYSHPNNMKGLVITKVRVYPEPHLTLMSLLVGDDSLSANKVGVARVALLVLTFYNSIPSFKAGEICG